MPKKTMTEKRQYTEEEILEAQKALMAAVDAGDAAQVKQVIEDYGDRIDPNARDRLGRTALIAAAEYGDAADVTDADVDTEIETIEIEAEEVAVEDIIETPVAETEDAPSAQDQALDKAKEATDKVKGFFKDLF